MVNKRPTNRVRAKVWLPTLTADIEGTPEAAILQLFKWLPGGAERRAEMLDVLVATHENMTALERVARSAAGEKPE